MGRSSSLALLQQTFEQYGVEFIDGPGVRMRGEVFEFQKYEGPLFLKQQTNHMIEQMQSGGSVWICSSGEEKIQHFGAADDKNYQAAVQRHQIEERIIVPQNNSVFLSEKKAYRWLPARVIGPTYWMLYGEYIAWLMWEKPQRAIIIRSPSLAQAYRAQFSFLWDMAKPLQKPAAF